MQHTWLCLQFINNVAQQVLAQGNTSNDRQLVKRSTCKRKQAIKVTKNNGYWPSKNYVDVLAEENENYYKHLNK